MTDRRDRPDVAPERELDAFVDGADRAAEDDVRRHVRPAFAAIVARAHRIDPQAISTAAIDRSVNRSRLGRGTSEAAGGSDELVPFVAAARAEAQRDIDAREQDGVPAWTRPRVASAPRYAVIFMVAAAAAIAIIVPQVLKGWRADDTSSSRAGSQALAVVDASADIHDASRAEDPPIAPVRRSGGDGPEKPSGPPIAPAEFVVPNEPAPLEPDELSSDSPSVPRRGATRVPVEDALAQLEARADAALARGRRDLADSSYAEIIRRGGRHPRVELAFADRFVLTREAAVGERRALWSAYLERFPNGRFSDDARAGLCRTADADDKPSCWSGYVADFPSGAHRAVANRWVASADAATSAP